MNLEQLTTACSLYNRVFSNKSYLTEDKIALIETTINEKNVRLIRYYDIKYHARGEKDQYKVLANIQQKYNISDEELTSTEGTIGKDVSDIYYRNYECNARTKRDNSEDVVLLWLKQLDCWKIKIQIMYFCGSKNEKDNKDYNSTIFNINNLLWII